MSSNPNKRRAGVRSSEEDSRTTADATPALAATIEGMRAGALLEQQLGRAFTRLGQPFDAAGVSLSWTGAERLVKRLTALGCYLEIQTHAGSSVCRVLRMLKGNAIAKQLASMQAATLPEAVAKAALLTLVEMEPPPLRDKVTR
jgi:hypothetical protein